MVIGFERNYGFKIGEEDVYLVRIMKMTLLSSFKRNIASIEKKREDNVNLKILVEE